MPLRRCTLVSCALGLALALPAAAHDRNFCEQPKPHPIDAHFDRAMAAAGGVTFDMKEAIGAAIVAWDAELNRGYRSLLRTLPAGQAAALRSAQRAWLAWDRSQELADLTLLDSGGSMDVVQVMDLHRLRLRARVCELATWRDATDPPAAP